MADANWEDLDADFVADLEGAQPEDTDTPPAGGDGPPIDLEDAGEIPGENTPIVGDPTDIETNADDLDLEDLDTPPADTNNPDGTPKPTDTPNPDNPDGEPKPEDVSGTEGLSGIELYLAQFDIEGGMIGFNDGSQEHFDNLDPEKQQEILQQLHSTKTTETDQNYGLDENEVGLINYMRSNQLTVEQMVEQMVVDRMSAEQNFQQLNNENFTEMSDDVVYMRMLKEINPEATDEQLESELTTAKNLTGFAQQANYFRNQLVNNQTQAAHQQQVQEQQQAELALNQERANIVNAVTPINEIAGVELNDSIKNSVLDKVLEVNTSGDSLFMEEAFSDKDPGNVFKAAFWYYNGEDIVKQRDDYWKREKAAAYKRGRESVLGSDGVGERVSFSKQNTTKQQVSAPQGTREEDSFSDDDFFQ